MTEHLSSTVPHTQPFGPNPVSRGSSTPPPPHPPLLDTLTQLTTIRRCENLSVRFCLMDNLTPEQRHYCMSRIKAKDTSIETRVRSALHRRGYRFRKHAKNLPGTPDVVFTKAQVAVFIDGDFWHGYGFDAWSHKLSTPWHDKILTNIQRDAHKSSYASRYGLDGHPTMAARHQPDL